MTDRITDLDPRVVFQVIRDDVRVERADRKRRLERNRSLCVDKWVRLRCKKDCNLPSIVSLSKSNLRNDNLDHRIRKERKRGRVPHRNITFYGQDTFLPINIDFDSKPIC